MLRRLPVALFGVACLLGTAGCNELCSLSCSEGYSSCLEDDPVVSLYCQSNYDACEASCEEDPEDAGAPEDVSGAGLDR